MEQEFSDMMKRIVTQIETDDLIADVAISQQLWDIMREARALIELYESKQ